MTHKLEDRLDEKYNELCLFKNALTAIDKSENLRKLLQIVLAFGNFLHANASGKSSKVKYGVHGFHLESLRTLKTVKSHDDDSLTLLAYIYSYCKTRFPNVLNVIDDLKACREATKLKGHELYQNIISVDEELLTFQKELRKYRDMKNKKNDNRNEESDITHNKFELSMGSFNRRARDSCRTLLDVWNECSATANRIAQEYDFEFSQNESYEQLIQVFDDFIFDLKKARVGWEALQNQKKVQS
ncbi:hypothetical protein RFI_21363 [Reticulomyxa filosa]|uniref:FH2 domain-containing protein n=1 Tax=Reticulomyxa filosa TaxID=46433 RepID=X6MPS5_RETFI|nr:hypothetical protein RFI_21363 [Reticulomyxa filosa]|eukprot:ETO15998.1 hypothetical protein RFI_21363 [Reticulomyxa filosa]